MFLKVRMVCIKDYQQVSQERKCRSEAVGYSPWSVSGLLPHLRWELQILALVCCEFWVGVRHSFAEQEAHAVQSSAPQVTVFNPCAPYTVLSWTVRWAKTSALAVNTNQCHELRDSGCCVSFNSPESWVMQWYDASSCLSCSRVLPQQISVSWYQNTWYVEGSCILYRLRFYLKCK